MHIGVLGTGVVGRTLASFLAESGHRVTMGSRSSDNPAAADWARSHGDEARAGDFAEAARAEDLLVNCTAGMASLEALKQAGTDNLAGKVLIDLANPLDFSGGMPPKLSVCNDDSLGEQIQRAFPDTRVVKALNTVNCEIMTRPDLVPGEHALFICGNDDGAKQTVTAFLRDELGWQQIWDLGDISGARTTEMMLPFWIRLWQLLGTTHFNIAIVRAPAED